MEPRYLAMIGTAAPNCWEFVTSFYEDKGITVAPDSYKNSQKFLPVDEPQTGDLVVLPGRHGALHCGIVVDHGMLHTVGRQVTFQNRILFPNARYYRPRCSTHS